MKLIPNAKQYAKCDMIAKTNNLNKYFFRLCIYYAPSAIKKQNIGATILPKVCKIKNVIPLLYPDSIIHNKWSNIIAHTAINFNWFEFKFFSFISPCLNYIFIFIYIIRTDNYQQIILIFHIIYNCPKLAKSESLKFDVAFFTDGVVNQVLKYFNGSSEYTLDNISSYSKKYLTFYLELIKCKKL